jgi:hypothetical protein
MGQHMEQVEVRLKIGFFPFLDADLAIFWFLTLPTFPLSCSEEVLTRLSQKKIIKAEHDRKNSQNYGHPPDHGIHLVFSGGSRGVTSGVAGGLRGLWVASVGLRVASVGLRVASGGSRVASVGSRVATARLQVATGRLQVT